MLLFSRRRCTLVEISIQATEPLSRHLLLPGSPEKCSKKRGAATVFPCSSCNPPVLILSSFFFSALIVFLRSRHICPPVVALSLSSLPREKAFGHFRSGENMSQPFVATVEKTFHVLWLREICRRSRYSSSVVTRTISYRGQTHFGNAVSFACLASIFFVAKGYHPPWLRFAGTQFAP